jgi:hypothetical protein
MFAGRFLVALALAGCSAPPTPPPSNTSMRPEPPEPPGAKLTYENVGLTDDPATGEIVGSIRNHLNEPLIGTTVVATSPVLTGEVVAIADEGGEFDLKALAPGRYKLVFYFTDTTYSGEVVVEAGREVRVKVANWNPDTPRPTIEMKFTE